MHGLIYDADKADAPDARLQQSLEEALTCWQTADHYLRMLGSVIDERTGDSQAPWPAIPRSDRATRMPGLEDLHSSSPAHPTKPSPHRSNQEKGYVACSTLSAHWLAASRPQNRGSAGRQGQRVRHLAWLDRDQDRPGTWRYRDPRFDQLSQPRTTQAVNHVEDGRPGMQAALAAAHPRAS